MATCELYAPPALTPLPFMAFNKHQTRSLLPPADTHAEDDYDAAALMAEYGSPLYVVSERRLRRDYRDFLAAFSEPFVDTRVAYSVKTNYLPSVCAILRAEGAWMEVVSGLEYELARALDVPGAEIIMNGPQKTRADMERAIGEGAILNLDNFDELNLVEQVASALGKTARVGIRVSFRYGAAAWTKFGFSDDNGDAERALKRIARSRHLDLELLHHHGGTFVLVHDLYAQAADRLIALARRARELGLKPTMVDFGGGYPSQNTLKPQFDLPGGSARTGSFWFPYAEAILSRLEQARELFGGKPTLVLEPGRALVDACTQLLCTVTAKKHIPGQGEAIIVDAGVNLVPTVCYYDHAVSLPSEASEGREGRLSPVDVYGPLCMQTDKLREQALLPAMEVGDPLVIGNVGAYCHTQSMQFIHTRPATVLVGEKGPEVIRRRETWRDVFALDRIPQRLKPSGCTL
jgi:diaminopimelate decarboxylase